MQAIAHAADIQDPPGDSGAASLRESRDGGVPLRPGWANCIHIPDPCNTATLACYAACRRKLKLRLGNDTALTLTKLWENQNGSGAAVKLPPP